MHDEYFLVKLECKSANARSKEQTNSFCYFTIILWYMLKTYYFVQNSRGMIFILINCIDVRFEF